MDSKFTQKHFKEKKYVFLDDFLDADDAKKLADEVRKDLFVFGGRKDEMVEKSPSIRDLEVTDRLLEFLIPHLEEYSGLKLLPTYAYSRLYFPGETLKAHLDRPACEISVTLTLDFDGEPWEIFIADTADTSDMDEVVHGYNEEQIPVKNKAGFKMQPGQGVMYRGQEMVHWRDEYTSGNWQIQVFLHYVDANGPNTDQIYDGRPCLAQYNPRKLELFYANKLKLDQFNSMEDCLKNLEYLHQRMIETVNAVNERTYAFNISNFGPANMTVLNCNTNIIGDQTIRNNVQQKLTTILFLEDVKLNICNSDKSIDLDKGAIITMPSFVTYSLNNQDQNKVVAIVMETYGPPFK